MVDIGSRKRNWEAVVLAFVVVSLRGLLNKGWSEDLPSPATAGQHESNDVEQRLRILERKREVSSEEPVVKGNEAAFLKADKDGFQIQSADKNFVLKIRALLQSDSRFFMDDKAGNQTDTFLIRRARPILEGTLFGYTRFRLAPDLASNGKTTLFDAYLDVAPWTFAKLRIGKFKPPIGLEHLQSDENLTFAERAFPSLLVPSRDTGIQLFGDVLNGALNYGASFTNGTGDNNVNTSASAPVTADSDANDGKEGALRIAAKPFKNGERALLQGLGLGLAGSYAKEAGGAPTYVSPGQISVFAAAAANTPIPDGEHVRIAADLNWYHRLLGFYSEWVQSSQVWRVGPVRSRIVNQAWQVAVSCVLTGEGADYSGVKPRKTFDPRKGTWGAFEVASRYQVLYLDPDNFTQNVVTSAGAVQRASAFGIGLNWYLNNNLRFTTDYDQTTFNKGAASGDRPNEKVMISRWQLVF